MTQWIDAVLMRGGTSKGLFFDERDLPPAGAERDAVLTTALGSPDPFGRQLDGLGGGTSSTSKVVAVAVSDRPGVDLEYTFGQVAVGEAVVDYSGNCGNLSSAVVPFALLTGLLEVSSDGPAAVRVLNTNIDKIVEVRLDVRDGLAETEGGVVLPGVAGAGAPIELAYVDPAGSRTTGALPSGHPVDLLDVGNRDVEVSLVDVASPVVFLDAAQVGLAGVELPDDLDGRPDVLALLDDVRRAAAVAMGMCRAPDEAALAFPKIAVVAPPADSVLLDGTHVPAVDCDVVVRTLSMDVTHRAVPGTAALCAAAAAAIPGTVLHRLSAGSGSELRLATPSGVVVSAADVRVDGDHVEVVSASLLRTARALMRGQVALR